MKRIAPALLVFVVASFHSALAAAEMLPCDLRDLAKPTDITMPSTDPQDGAIAKRTATISATVADDGSLSDAEIEVSSGSPAFNRALREYTTRIVVGGNCRAFGEGRVSLVFRPDLEGWPAIAGAWRAAHTGPDSETADGFLMTFMAGPRYAAQPGETIDAHYACEATLVNTRRTSMPADDGRLTTDEIHELSEAGEILGAWRVPLEAEPLGVRGDALVVDLHNAPHPGTVAIGRDGSIVVADKPAPTAPDANFKCPASKLPESGYRWCRRLEDAASHAPRLVAYEGPCT